MYRVTLERFEGPLDLLLQFIEQEKLDISEVSLSRVTEQYLQYIDKQTDLPPEELADFLLVAAKLILIKSRLLLPQLFGQEEDEVGEDLIRQLAVYKLYLTAGKGLYKLFRSRRTCYARERLPRSEQVTFSPPPSLNTSHLTTIYRAILHELESFVRPLPELINQTISLKEKIAVLRGLFFTKRKVNFHEILSEAKSRAEIIIIFLALLELVKQRCINVSQEHIDSHIVVSALAITENP